MENRLKTFVEFFIEKSETEFPLSFYMLGFGKENISNKTEIKNRIKELMRLLLITKFGYEAKDKTIIEIEIEDM